MPAEEIVGRPDAPAGLIEQTGFDPFPAGSRFRWLKMLITHDDSMQIEVRYRPEAPLPVIGEQAAATPTTPFAGKLEIRNGIFGEHEALIVEHLGSLFEVALLPPEH